MNVKSKEYILYYKLRDDIDQEETYATKELALKAKDDLMDDMIEYAYIEGSDGE